VTVAGTAKDTYSAAVSIVASGTLGAGRFRYSLDVGPDGEARSWSDQLLIPSGGTYVVPGTGLTLTFVAGAGPTFFEAGDRHSFITTAASYAAGDLTAAFNTIDEQIGSRTFEMVFLAGKHATASAAATLAAALATALGNLEAIGIYARAIMDAGNDNPAATQSGWAAFADTRVACVFGDAGVISANPISGRGVPRVPALNPFAVRAAETNLSENPGRKASGALRGVVYITHDERVKKSFNAVDRITTLRTDRGEPGAYVTNGLLKSAPGSDYKYWAWGRVIDRITRIVYREQDKFTLSDLKVKNDGTGYLTEQSAQRVEKTVRRALDVGVRKELNAEGEAGHVSALAYTVKRDHDFLSTQTLVSSCKAVPNVPVEQITTTIGFAREVSE
jgi:hypothetical protein